MLVRSRPGLDQVCMIFIPDGLDLLISGINNLRNNEQGTMNREQLNAKARLVGRVSLFLLTDLIIRAAGKLLCQLFFRFMLFSWCWLGRILGIDGLDKGICWFFLRVGERKRPLAKVH
jgi:hypothetical protein